MSKRNPGGLISTTGLREPSATDQSQNSGVWDLDEQYRAGTNGTWANQSGQVYEIGNSLRFRNSVSANLTRTPTVAGNRRMYTLSAWIKRSLVDGQLLTSGASSVSNGFSTFGLASDSAYIVFYTNQSHVYNTTALFRDPSAWYHVVYALDSAQAVASERIKFYVNGSLVQLNLVGGYTVVPQNFDSSINNTTSHVIGALRNSGGVLSQFYDGYISEYNFVDGQALTPDYFGYYDFNGVWQPKKYTGSYGTNGFYLPFNPTAYGDSITTTTLGFDKSGNGNNWTTNNISVAAGVTYDSMVDSPTNSSSTADTGLGGQIAGNFAVLNPLVPISGTITNGNLSVSIGAAYAYANGTIPVPLTGKWIFEATFNTNPTTDNYNVIGLITTSFNKSGSSFTNAGAYGIEDVASFGQRFVQNGVAQGSVTVPAGTVIQCLIDRDAGTLTFTRNGVLQTQAGSTVTIPAVELLTVVGSYSNSVNVNFGQRPFAYAAPAGFKCLNTANLPQPTIPDGREYFNTVTWTGNNAISRAITGLEFQPDFTWVKSRSLAASSYLANAVVGSASRLQSNDPRAEAFQQSNGYISSFDSNGFTLDKGSSTDPTFTGWYETNQSGQSYVAWNWKANGAGVSNTAGSITSTVSAGVTQGFSVVTYTGVATNNTNFTVGHGLGVNPAMIIIKNRGWAASSKGWSVFHQAISTGGVFLDSTDISESQNFNFFWGEQPNSTTFSIRSDTTVSEPNRFRTNGRTDGYVAYCFSEVEGYSKFGSYVGNGSVDGAFVYTGFRPKFILIKSTTDVESWVMLDAVRNTANVVGNNLLSNVALAENTVSFARVNTDFLSNGFKLRNAGDANQSITNKNASTYIFMAFAEHPFKTSRAR